MRKLVYLALGLFVLALFSAPGWAQEGGGKGKGQSAAAQSKQEQSPAAAAEERSNKAGEVRGTERAEEVHEMKTEGKGEPGGKKAKHAKKAKKQKKAEGDKGGHGKGKGHE